VDIYFVIIRYYELYYIIKREGKNIGYKGAWLIFSFVDEIFMKHCKWNCNSYHGCSYLEAKLKTIVKFVPNYIYNYIYIYIYYIYIYIYNLFHRIHSTKIMTRISTQTKRSIFIYMYNVYNKIYKTNKISYLLNYFSVPFQKFKKRRVLYITELYKERLFNIEI